MMILKNAFVVFMLFVIYCGIMIASDIPKRSELIEVTSENTKSTKFFKNQGYVTMVRFNTNSGQCINVGSSEDGFSSLLKSVEEGQSFSIYYFKERALFSIGPPKHTRVVEIVANNETVKTYESHRKKTVTGGFLLIGIGILFLLIIFYSGQQGKKVDWS